MHPECKVEKMPLFRHIRLSENTELSEDLSCADAFITDYSSSVFYVPVVSKALQREIPMYLWVPDLDSYKIGNRGVHTEFFEDFPGQTIKDFDFKKVLQLLRSPSHISQEKNLAFWHKYLSGCQPQNNKKIVNKILDMYTETTALL